MIEVVGTDLDELVPEWRRIAELRGNPFITPEWYFATASESPMIVAVRRQDGSLLGLLPLVAASWRGIRALRFGGHELGDRFHPVATPGDEPEAAAECFAALAARGERRVALDKCADESSWLEASRGRGRSAMAFRTVVTTGLPRIDLTDRDWDGYLGGRSKNLRSRIRRMERKLIREHGMTVRTVSQASELDPAFETLFALHDARRGEMGGTSLSSARHRSDLLEFCRSALKHGWLRLRIMECDDQAVAAFLGWRLGDSYCFYQSGFDPDWGRLSVGLVSLALAIRDAFEEGAAEFDLLLGEEEYKQRLAEDSREVSSGIMTRRFDPALGMAHAESCLRVAVRSLRRARNGDKDKPGPVSV